MPRLEARYISFCPYGTVCKKGCARLGADDSEESCRWRIQNHLHSSPYHNMDNDKATEESRLAAIDVEEVEVPESGDEQEQHSGKGKSDGKGSRSTPYASKGKGKSHGKADHRQWNADDAWWHAPASEWQDGSAGEASSSTSNASAIQLTTAAKPDGKTLQSLAKCEAAMRTAARMARAAALAFEEEAAVLAVEISRMSQ